MDRPPTAVTVNVLDQAPETPVPAESAPMPDAAGPKHKPAPHKDHPSPGSAKASKGFLWTAVILLDLYALVVLAIVVQSATDPTPGPGRESDDRYFDRHAEVVFLGATGALVFALVVLRTAGDTLAARVQARRFVLGPTVLLTGFGIGLAELWERKGLPGAAMLGVITLASTLLGGAILSKRETLGAGEVRTAITLSTVAMFFAMVGFAPDIEAATHGVLEQAVENFWVVVATVVGFYFGGHTVERIRGKTADG
jgi:hypothetical protein